MILCRDLNKTSQSQDVLDMVKLATYHDFMALLAVSYRTTISAGLTLVDARHSAVNTLVRFLRSVHHALIHDIIRIMIYIAKTVMPAPFISPTATTSAAAAQAVYCCHQCPTSRIHASII